MALIFVALLVAIWVPAGYMPSMTSGAFAMRPCHGHAGGASIDAMLSDGHVHAGAADHDDAGDHDGPEMACIFSSLSAPDLPATNPLLLVIAVVSILVATFRVEQRPILGRGIYLRPPSQGPPPT
jgi:hypothetical protein